jgi:N-acetylneuraminic acid mutarotase
MRLKRMNITVSLLLFLSFWARGQFWQQQANFPGNPRDDGAQFSIGNLHFCGTGRGSNFACTGDFFVFDSYNQTWNTIASLPIWQERQYASAFSYQAQGYILGGENCNGYFFKSFWRYEPLTDTWEPMPEFPGTGRAGAQHFIIGPTIYWVGGRNETGILNEVWCFHFDTQQWEQLSNLPFAGVWRGIGFSNDPFGYVTGGRTNEANQTGWNTQTWRYDPQLDLWNDYSAQLSFGTRMYIGGAQKDSLLFVFGGVDINDNVLNTFEKINLNTFQIEQLLPFTGAARKGCMSFVGNDYFHLSTGIAANDRLNETWRIALSPEAQIKEKNLFEVAIDLQDAVLLISSSPELIGETIKIKDIHGRVLAELSIKKTHEYIPLENLNSGLYFVEIRQMMKQFWR